MAIATTTRTRPDERDGARRDPRTEAESRVVVTSAELAECTCPEWCERDHDRD